MHPEPHSYPTPSTFRAVFVDGTALQPPPVHVLAPFCGRHDTPTTSRPRFSPFLGRQVFGAGLTMAVVDNCLCISELPNVLAANGEQEEYGSA